jgi:hypothetical protein
MGTSSNKDLRDGCQLMTNMDCGREPWMWYLRRRIRNALRKLRRMLGNRGMPQRLAEVSRSARPLSTRLELDAGDRVRVRSLDEIRRTFDASGACHGCAFLEPMARYCGKELRVARRLERFFDEKRWRMLKCKDVVLLEGVFCDGSGHPDTQGCQRMCFFFWRTEWLEKLV